MFIVLELLGPSDQELVDAESDGAADAGSDGDAQGDTHGFSDSDSLTLVNAEFSMCSAVSMFLGCVLTDAGSRCTSSGGRRY